MAIYYKADSVCVTMIRCHITNEEREYINPKSSGDLIQLIIDVVDIYRYFRYTEVGSVKYFSFLGMTVAYEDRSIRVFDSSNIVKLGVNKYGSYIANELRDIKSEWVRST